MSAADPGTVREQLSKVLDLLRAVPINNVARSIATQRNSVLEKIYFAVLRLDRIGFEELVEVLETSGASTILEVLTGLHVATSLAAEHGIPLLIDGLSPYPIDSTADARGPLPSVAEVSGILQRTYPEAATLTDAINDLFVESDENPCRAIVILAERGGATSVALPPALILGCWIAAGVYATQSPPAPAATVRTVDRGGPPPVPTGSVESRIQVLMALEGQAHVPFADFVCAAFKPGMNDAVVLENLNRRGGARAPFTLEDVALLRRRVVDRAVRS